VISGKNGLKTGIYIALAAAMAVSIQGADAQERTLQIAQSTAPVALDIPAGPLPDALANFGRATRLQVLYPSELARDLRSPGVRGSLPTEQALQQLLSGTGLGYRFTNDTTVTLERQTTGTLNVAPASVEAQRFHDPISLPREYPGGQVARGGKVGVLGNKDMMDTPFNQTSYTSKLIQDQQVQTLGKVVENDPSVDLSFTSGTGIDNFFIRGLASQNADVAFGGLYGVAPTNGNMMAAESIERVEVLRGPSALLNGIAPRGTVGGTINVVPKRAGDEPLTQFTPSYASDSQLGGHVDIGRRFGAEKEFGVRFNGVHRSGDTAIERNSQETELAALGLDFRGETVRLSADLGFQAQHADVTRRPVALATGVQAPEALNGRHNYSQPWTFADNENTYGAVRGEVDVLENLTFFAAAGGDLMRTSTLSENPTLQDANGRITGAPFSVRSYTETSTTEVGVRGSLSTGFVNHNLVLANAWYWEQLRLLNTQFTSVTSNIYNPVFAPSPNLASLPDPEDTRVTQKLHNSSLTFVDTLSVLDERVQLILGGRRQQVNADNFSAATGARASSYDKTAITPAVGFVVKPLDYMSVYGNYIEGLTSATAPTSAANAGETFPPMQTKQTEVGTKFDFGTFATTFSAFEIMRPNTVTDTTTNIFSVNGEQINRGLEVTSFGEVTDAIRILGGMTLLDAELTKTAGGVNQGKRPANVPELRAVLGGEWDTPFLQGLALSTRATYSSAKFVDQANLQEVDGWLTFDLGARYTLETQGVPVVIRASINNVFDEYYWASADGRIGLGAPRTFLLSTSFNF
jgi:iron complex outermembrane receptor protein